MSTEYGSTTPDTTASTKDVAADQAKDVAAQAKSTAADVAGTAKEQGQALLSQTSSHARGLFDQARSELSDQAGMQTMRAGDLLRTLASELQDMAGASTQSSGIAAGLVGDVASRAESAASWLENRQPAELLDDVRRYARRNPGTFLAVAGLAGFLGGRLTRGLTAQDEQPRAIAATPYRGTSSYDATYPVATSTDAPVVEHYDTTSQPSYGVLSDATYDTTYGRTPATGRTEVVFDQEAFRGDERPEAGTR